MQKVIDKSNKELITASGGNEKFELYKLIADAHLGLGSYSKYLKSIEKVLDYNHILTLLVINLL